MKLAIVGGRERQVPHEELDAFVSGFEDELVVVTGDATGVDACARLWAVERGHELVVCCAGSLRDLEPYVAGYTNLVVIKCSDWLEHGPKAGPMRNAALVASADVCLAFPGKGPGTRGTIRLFKAENKPTEVVELSGT